MEMVHIIHQCILYINNYGSTFLLIIGALCNGRVRCPWHGACFNVKTGDIEDFPGLDSIPKYDVSLYFTFNTRLHFLRH